MNEFDTAAIMFHASDAIKSFEAFSYILRMLLIITRSTCFQICVGYS